MCFKFPFLVSEDELHQRLCSESVLLIRREDVLQRLTPDCCLSSLSEPRWRALDVEGEAAIYAFYLCRFFIWCANMLQVSFFPSPPPLRFLPVLGQVKQMVLEEEQEQDGAKLTHIRIPAAYSSGVTLFALRQSELGQELLSAPELSSLGLH